MSFKILGPLDDDTRSTYSMLIYGTGGVGKTTTALSSKNSILIDFEDGTKRVWSGLKRTLYKINVNSYEEVIELLDSDEINHFDTLVFDSLTTMSNSIFDNVYKIDSRLRDSFGSPTQKAWGALKARICDLIKRVKELKKNIIFIAHSTIDVDERKSKISVPNMGGGSGGMFILAWLDVVGYMRQESGKSTIYFNSENGEFSTKNSFNLASSYIIPNPEKIGKNTFVQDVIDKAFALKNKQEREMLQEYKSNLEDMCLELASIRNCDDCNKALEYFQNEVRYKNFTEWKAKLYEKAKSLGLDYNKETGAFEGKDEEENVVDNSIAA